MDRKSSNRLGVGCVALFGLPFAAVGTYMAYRLVAMLWLAFAASGWVEIEATLRRVALDTSRGDSETAQALAEYEYEFEGRQYTGDRIGLLSGSVNVGSYQRDLYERLKEAFDRERPVPCYVNPRSPGDSLLDRRLRPVVVVSYLPFALLFPAVGYGLMIGAWLGVHTLTAERRRREAHPDEPWMWREDWAAGRIESSGRREMSKWGFFAASWNLIAFPGAIVVLTSDRDQPWAMTLVLLLFPAIGLCLLWKFAVTVRRWLRFGPSVFRMGRVPGVVGGELVGVVLASRKIEAAERVRLRLSCERTTGSGDQQKTYTAWEDERVIAELLDTGDPGRVGVPVRFVIPYHAMSTDPHDGVAWKLRAEAELPGVDYKAEFDTPVFATADSRKDVEAQGPSNQPYELVVTLHELLAEEGIRFEPLAAGGLRLVSPPFRHKLTAVSLGVAFLVLAGVSIGVLLHQQWLIGGVCGLFGAIFALACGDAFVNSSELTIDGDRWRVRSGWYGFRRTTEFAPSAIRSIHTKEGWSHSSGDEYTQWRHVAAKLDKGEKVTLARSIRSRVAERKLLEELRERAGLDSPA